MTRFKKDLSESNSTQLHQVFFNLKSRVQHICLQKCCQITSHCCASPCSSIACMRRNTTPRAIESPAWADHEMKVRIKVADLIRSRPQTTTRNRLRVPYTSEHCIHRIRYVRYSRLHCEHLARRSRWRTKQSSFNGFYLRVGRSRRRTNSSAFGVLVRLIKYKLEIIYLIDALGLLRRLRWKKSSFIKIGRLFLPVLWA